MVELVRQNLRINKKLYKHIEDELRQCLDKDIILEHVGSTVIPNMFGKNIIDILIGVNNNEQLKKTIKILEEKGFVSSSKHHDNIYQFMSSTAKETHEGDIHLHLVIKNSERFNEFIILKQYLLNNKEEAKTYSDFKKKILKNGYEDRKEYKKIKSEYVSNLLKRAKDELI